MSIFNEEIDLLDDSHMMLLEQWKMCIERIEAVHERRITTNTFFLTINLGVLGITEYFPSVTPVILGIFGICISIVWFFMLSHFKSVNEVRYEVVEKIEQKLPSKPLLCEWELTKSKGILKRFASNYTLFLQLIAVAFCGVYIYLLVIWI